MIHIDTSKVPLEFRNDPGCQVAAAQSSAWFNSPDFDAKERAVLFLHEGCHLVYSRSIGFDPQLSGPGVRYDPDTETFSVVDSSLEGLSYEIKMNADPIQVAKVYIGPVHVEEKLLNHRSQREIWADSVRDIETFNKWFSERSQLKGDLHLTSEAIRDSIYRDCRSPAFRRKLWDAAREFETRVFGT
jgi:hypothetical protein